MKAGLFTLLFSVSIFAQAQNDQPRSYNMFWAGYYNYIRLNDKWNLNSDIQHRTKDGFKTNSQSLIRTGLVYKFNKTFSATAGLAHFRFYIKNDLTRGEWRPWQEIAASNVIGKLKISNRIRTEERYNQKVLSGAPINEYNYNWRFRYKIELEFPLGGHSIAIGNELMLNAGKTIKNQFDQNRTYISYNLRVRKNVKLQLQYLFIDQFQASLNNYDRISVIRFNIHHTIQ
jgi:hypothetical protein